MALLLLPPLVFFAAQWAFAWAIPLLALHVGGFGLNVDAVDALAFIGALGTAFLVLLHLAAKP